ncbi:transketolase [uncultured Vagococcus sp.]|uniref:transketolase n=1 Tax=uncultured Vagococcus sp. TaxID=189676 RepID=UPI0028D6960F|nr:transketolase [uncultured Vagococcus sp.]
MFTSLDQQAVNTIRALSLDAIEGANSGHPGLPLGAAPMAYVLWSKFLTVNPLTSTNWTNRDRFILSAGHGSAMLYSLLHLAGYQVSLADLKNFRQWGSKTPGHPEVHHTDGVEATTGPLGQGLGMAVGMAMAEAHLSTRYNQAGYPIVDHYTYSLCGDGDLMEGISQEACSLAGHLKLGKLIVLYDSNDISLDGPTDKSFTENVGQRFIASGWHYLLVEDGNDLEAIYQAIACAKAHSEQPTLIEVKTIIGYGSSKQGTSSVHGSPLGKEETEAVKTFYGLDKKQEFHVSEEVKTHFSQQMVAKGELAEREWGQLFTAYGEVYPELAAQYQRAYAGDLPEDWDQQLPRTEVGRSVASRVTSKETIQEIAKAVPYFWGGSADLSSSNNTMIVGEADFAAKSYGGRNIWFGVREFAMAAALNGIQLHGGTRVYGGTFFVFVDYLRAALRLSALQKLPVIYVLTHDSVAVGEDGPTHEPIEQLASLRCLPNVQVIRPADGNETVAAWKVAMTSRLTPTVLVLSRQNLPVIEGSEILAEEGVARGGYILSPQHGRHPDGILIATGSEVALAVQTQKLLREQDQDVSVVSLPCFELFEQQSKVYQEMVLPPKVKRRLSIEMGASFGWERYVGTAGASLAIDCFGASAPGETVIDNYGFTVENVMARYNKIIG